METGDRPDDAWRRSVFLVILPPVKLSRGKKVEALELSKVHPQRRQVLECAGPPALFDLLVASQKRQRAAAIQNAAAHVQLLRNSSLENYLVLGIQDSSSVPAFKMLLNLFQCFAFGFGQEEERGDEIDHRAGGEQEKHRRVTVLANHRQEHRGDGGGH